jgi:TolB-like protein/Tfp pilus assembly protein PilF
MTPAQLQTIEEIFYAALGQDADDVARFLETTCEGDELLRGEVEALLALRQRVGSFIETPAVGIATRIIRNGQADLLVGLTFGHYKISKRIGAGGMGEVYLATDIVAGRKAALKLLPMRFTGDAERLKRFQQEAHAVVGLNHPNILTVYEIGEDHSTHYIASELIEGETLRQRLMRGRMEVGEAVDVAIQVASALAAAHETGIIHRDIKPENIMLRPDGYVKVLDFGIAKLAEQEVPTTTTRDEALLLVETNLGAVLGTVRYMSPEQACGAPVDQGTDIWSLGVVLYEMVTGHAPFTGDTPREVMSAILEMEPPPLTSYIRQTPTELQQIISKTLRKDRAQRYRSAHELLQALKDLRRKLGAELERAAAPLWLRWARSPAAVVLALLAAAFALALPFYRHPSPMTISPPEKTIAVLPFENLSPDPENAYFADGVQDEILTDLARIADLKVIGRSSVMQYKTGVTRNLRKIGQQLGVAHLVEGSVQRSGNRVRVNAQLVDTRTDKHLWGQTYDRDLADVFAIQSEIAQKIADQFEVKISPREKAAIEEQPTKDLAAYDLYVRAAALIDKAPDEGFEKNEFQAVDLLNQAVARDPGFLLAYCRLAEAHDQLYFQNVDRTPNRLALAKAAIDTAFRLKPDSGEAHLALATHLYFGYFDYDRARDELAIALRTLPNNARIFEWSALIDRRQNRWHDAVRNHERAVELDPRYVRILDEAGWTYWCVRDYSQARATFDRLIALEPNNIGHRLWRAWFEVHERADLRPVQAVVEKVFDGPALLRTYGPLCFFTALWARDPAAADRALAAITGNDFSARGEAVDFTRAYAKGLVARVKGDEDGARAAFSAARTEQEKVVRGEPDDFTKSPALCLLGLIDAALERKQEALTEGRRAVELLPVTKNALDGPDVLYFYAAICAQVGERDLAIEQLKTLAQIPVGASYGELRLDPFWDPLRGDPRFEKLVEEAKQPIALELVEKSEPEKSIAVLPFENLSKDEENAFFASGVQDEILNDLAKIADLKVISRTSVMQYKSGITRSLKEIAQQLGVGHVVEGSVGRAGNQVRVSVQLIDARTDTHLWAEHYDRDVSDVFAIQTEIAQQIADQLRSELSPAERAAIAERPTTDLVAYALYTKAKDLTWEVAWDDWEGAEKSLNRKVELLEKATQHDPSFALAYCALAKAQCDLFLATGAELSDLSRTRLELAKKAAGAALRVRPDLGEAHLELARYYFCAGDFDRARDELTITRRKLPNNSEALYIAARIDRRQNRWDDSLANFQKASELDPRNTEVAFWCRDTYFEMRRYNELEQLLTKDAASGTLQGPWTQLWLAMIKLAKGDAVAAQALLVQVPLDFSPTAWIWEFRFTAALYLRDYDAANRVITATPMKWADQALRGQPPESWADGQVAVARGDKQKAQSIFLAARRRVDATWGTNIKDERYFVSIAGLDAGLGRKEEAIREAQRAVDLRPIAKDSLQGPEIATSVALVYAWTGERERALEQLEIVAKIPAGPTYGDLRFNPCWDALRGDKRFDKIVAAAKAASR